MHKNESRERQSEGALRPHFPSAPALFPALKVYRLREDQIFQKKFDIFLPFSMNRIIYNE